mmetsp:Transcript_79435/g.227972  ORF Transcript_79435/g.227972 Transcript_79435/m.227972 type:complete len:277 (-) Transcript_79435:1454-2284(-)
MPKPLLPLPGGLLLCFHSGTSLVCLRQLVRLGNRFVLQSLDLPLHLVLGLALLGARAQCLHLRLALGLVQLPLQPLHLLLHLGLARAPHLAIPPRGLVVLAALGGDPCQLTLLRVCLHLTALHLVLGAHQLLPLLLALGPQFLPLVVELLALVAELLLPRLQHFRTLLDGSQANFQTRGLILSRLLALERILQLRLQLLDARLMLLGAALLLRAADLLDMLLDGLLEAVEVLHRELAHFLQLQGHGLRHLHFHQVDSLALLSPHVLQSLFRLILRE